MTSTARSPLSAAPAAWGAAAPAKRDDSRCCKASPSLRAARSRGLSISTFISWSLRTWGGEKPKTRVPGWEGMPLRQSGFRPLFVPKHCRRLTTSGCDVF